eukprot:scpid62704/ scgid12563/ 
MAAQPATDNHSAARVQLREKLQGLRGRCGKEVRASGGSQLRSHRRVDDGIEHCVRKASAPSRRRRNCLLVTLALFVVGWYVAFYVLPVYWPAYENYVAKKMGANTYSVQRILRRFSLPIMYRLPKLAELLHNPSCAFSNPYYLEDDALAEPIEDAEHAASILRGGKASAGKKGAKKSTKTDTGAPVGDDQLDDIKDVSDMCSCIGVRGAGRIRNRSSLKMKHLLRDAGVPLVLRVDNTTADPASVSIRLASLLSVMKEKRDNFTSHLCHVKPRGSKDECSSTVASVLDFVLSNAGNDMPHLHYTWSYCRTAAEMATTHLHTALMPHTYLRSKNIVFSESPTLVISKAVNDTSEEDIPDMLIADLDIGVYHQLSGRRGINLSPASCKRCKAIRVNLEAGEVLFFDSAVWVESLAPAFVLDGDSDMWSITYGYSIGSSKTALAPLYHTADWEADDSSC